MANVIKTLKNGAARQYTVTVFIVRPGEGYSVRCWEGVFDRDTETLLMSGTCPYNLSHGSTTPGL